MNAPASDQALAEPMLRLFRVDKLVPSKTHVQELRRLRFATPAGKQKLAELTESIKAKGVMQNLIVRPIGVDGTLEIVAGERRFLAAKAAGLKEVLVNIVKLDDEQILEVQLIENLQRDDLHELEEAEGYEELMKLKKISADQVAEMVGKSRSYVYARLKLTALCQEARKAFYSGELDASRALLIARIGHHDTQRQAMKEILRKQYGDAMSYREAAQLIQRDFMLRLVEAPFKVDDATLLPKAGACGACPKRTGNQPELFQDVKSADVCTDPKCFGEKRDAHFSAALRRLELAGKTVIQGKDAKDIFPHTYQHDQVGGGYVALDTICYDDPKRRKVRDVLGADSDAIVHVLNPHTKAVVPVAKSSAVTEALNAKGVKTQRQQSAAVQKKRATEQRDSDELLATIEEDQLLAVFKAAPARFGKAELLLLLSHLRQDYDWECDDLLAVAIAGKKDLTRNQVDKLLEGAKEDQLAKGLVAAIVLQNSKHYLDSVARKMARAYKVDLVAVEKKSRAAFKAKAAAAKKAPGLKSGKDSPWPFPTGSKVPADAPKKKAKAKGKKK